MTQWLEDPLQQFSKWFEKARVHPGLQMPEAVCLSTLDEEGFPDGRIVLLKHFDERGFVFYTNLTSPKGRSLRERPRAALTFYWEPCRRQVRIRGITQGVTEEEADTYFQTRPRLSQIGAWASKQSEPLKSRLILLQRVAKYGLKFAGRPVPRPPFWSGFRVIPLKMEFWQERPHRLHDRLLYTRREVAEPWTLQRLYP